MSFKFVQTSANYQLLIKKIENKKIDIVKDNHNYAIINYFSRQIYSQKWHGTHEENATSTNQESMGIKTED
ncbi:hypothetical protein BpHYR1_030693 [Brachionus plicatilis]|uniref:Uncharacterized protein n=1 Tax=Brachionus plicatilis TaxID=10195 RepID=A0A3M7SAS6_BRAPC|nr:hypothetical protein BpHYR1_030693 [Brachionus plicatilis]